MDLIVRTTNQAVLLPLDLCEFGSDPKPDPVDLAMVKREFVYNMLTSMRGEEDD